MSASPINNTNNNSIFTTEGLVLLDKVQWFNPTYQRIVQSSGTGRCKFFGENIPLSPALVRRASMGEIYRFNGYHTTNFEGLQNLLAIQNSSKSVSASAFKGSPGVNAVDMDIQGSMRIHAFLEGVHRHGCIAKITGEVLCYRSKDIFSEPDENGRRWVSYDMIVEGPHKDKLVEILVHDVHKPFVKNVLIPMVTEFVDFFSSQIHNPTVMRCMEEYARAVFDAYANGFSDVMYVREAATSVYWHLFDVLDGMVSPTFRIRYFADCAISPDTEKYTIDEIAAAASREIEPLIPSIKGLRRRFKKLAISKYYDLVSNAVTKIYSQMESDSQLEIAKEFELVPIAKTDILDTVRSVFFEKNRRGMAFGYDEAVVSDISVLGIVAISSLAKYNPETLASIGMKPHQLRNSILIPEEYAQKQIREYEADYPAKKITSWLWSSHDPIVTSVL